MYASILQYARSLRVSRLAGAGIAASLAVVVGAAGCDQSTPLCRTGTGPYTIKYTLTAGSGACADLDTDVVYVNSYNDIGEEGKPDLEKVSAALAPDRLASLLDNANKRLKLGAGGSPDSNPDHAHWAWGHFRSSEPTGDFCLIDFGVPGDKNTAQQDLPLLPPSDPVPASDGDTPNDKCDDTPEVPSKPEIPATSVAYEFSNWRVYFTAAHAGNSFSVHLKYTIDGSTCEYDGRAALFGQRQSCDKGDGTAQPEACDAVAHPEITKVTANCDPATGEVPAGGPEYIPADGLGTGSGVDPDFAVTCDPTLMCVLAKDVPALR